MAKVTQAAKVGVFVLASAGAAFGIYRVIGKGIGGGDGYVVHAYLTDATGLANHTRVTIAGIPVGQIDGIQLEQGRARVNVRVRTDVPLYENATVGKKSTSLLGEYAIVLTPGTPDRAELHDGDEIRIVLEQASTDQIMNDVAAIADRVRAVAEQLANSVGSQRGGENMSRILENLAQATEALNETIRENRALVHDTLVHVDSITANSAPEISRILENVRIVTEEVRVLVAAAAPREGQPGQPGEVRETIENINRASRSLESALAHIDSVADRLDRGEGTLGRLSKDETLINEVQGVAEGVNDYVGRLTSLQTVLGLRSDYNFLANTLKNYVDLRLQPREDKYYLIQLINDPRGTTRFTQTDVETTNPNDPPKYREIRTTTTDAFRFSLMFARRLGPFTGRFGILESTGGVGVDTHLLQNRFEITQDLFGFGEEIRPRYRLFLGYEFINHLWLLGGVDHLFLPNRRDYFLGLQLRFTDDDLKAILPFAGAAPSQR
jgi:phospholipid/cholesterol/gamma-HCH transport system substrate-binding protein